VAKSPRHTFNDDNAITLCRKHHLQTKGRENVFAAFFAGLIDRELVSKPIANKRDVPFSISKEELADLYWRERRSTIEIAKMKGCDPTYIQAFMRRYDIPRRGAREAAQNYRTKTEVAA
jgi:hypothetical protein